jgi:hypothetical protein
VLLPHATVAESLVILLQAACFVALMLMLMFPKRETPGERPSGTP